ncbi:MAG: hypothetical protein GXY91_04650 [Clostridia bacterium]|nr:hypothetical protein [Clostridia bacterium]
MEYGCPICNGLMSIDEICPYCQQNMKDMGRIEDLYTPYSPYEEQDDIPILQESINSCIHLFSCPECIYEERVIVPFKLF